MNTQEDMLATISLQEWLALRTSHAELLAALNWIANHATDGTQDYERMARLMVGCARAAIAKAEGV